ncbi:MAG TPA: cysteine desulfurase family protein, partial [Myxococcaceae bacterium]|nr:cysteine desulfurase family protein [Myxococcaceae bacterium]
QRVRHRREASHRPARAGRGVIYFDYNATTPLRPQVAKLLARAFAEPATGNSSSVHGAGRQARARVDAARARVAQALGCEVREVCFTASGSEADAMALKGAFANRADRARTRIVSSRIEHPAILGTLEQLQAQGAQLTLLDPQANGRVPVDALLDSLKPDVALCSLMWANNETGVIQPVAEAAQACRERGIAFHTDAVQATGKVPVGRAVLDPDLLSLSAHKFGGPAGVGALIVRRGMDLDALTPGHQEWGRRGGTHNVPYLESLALALSLATEGLPTEGPRIEALRDRLEREALARVPDTSVNGAGAPRVPNTANLRFEGADGEALLIALDLDGMCASAGAACASGSLKPSHVLTAMGLSSTQAHGSLRFSLGPETQESDVDRLIEALVVHVPRAREAARRGA